MCFKKTGQVYEIYSKMKYLKMIMVIIVYSNLKCSRKGQATGQVSYISGIRKMATILDWFQNIRVIIFNTGY